MSLKNKNINFKIRRSKVTDYAALSLLSLQRRGNQHCRLNGVAVDDAVLLQKIAPDLLNFGFKVFRSF